MSKTCFLYSVSFDSVLFVSGEFKTTNYKATIIAKYPQSQESILDTLFEDYGQYTPHNQRTIKYFHIIFFAEVEKAVYDAWNDTAQEQSVGENGGIRD